MWIVEPLTSRSEIDAVLSIEEASFTSPWTKEMYLASDYRAANFYKTKSFKTDSNEAYIKNAPVLNASSIWLTFEAMVKSLQVR